MRRIMSQLSARRVRALDPNVFRAVGLLASGSGASS
jgi:hypothetical protein